MQQKLPRPASTTGTLLVVLLASVAFPSSVQAHARVVRSVPKHKETVAVAPTRVELWFNELLDHGFNGIEVFAASELSSKQRVNLVRGEAKVDPKDRTHLSIELQALPPGEYIIEWRVLSRDGHSAPGRQSFTIKAP